MFLDIVADRYFCLPPASGAAFVRIAEGDGDEKDLEAVQPLIGRGMLIEDSASAGPAPPPAIETASRDLLERPYPRPKTALLIRLFASEIGIAWRLRTGSLLNLLQALHRREPKESSSLQHPDSRLEAIVGASMALSLVLRATDRCLVRAIAVHATCRRSGIHSRLVFGVRMNPFSAHSWVQLGSIVLVGDVEQVRIYKPILALG